MANPSKKTHKDTSAGSIARSAGSVGVAVFMSRILGLVREQVLAGLFGAGTAMDAFVVAFRIPNLLRDLFAEGALSAAFVTVFTEYDQERSREETWRLVNNVFTTITIILSLVVAAGMIFSHQLVMLLAPEFAEIAGKVELTKELTVIMFPFLVMISLSALLMGILNTRGHFFIPAMASTCFNIGSIVVGGGLALVLPRFGYPAITGMAIGTLAGGAGQMAIQLPLLFRHGFRFRPVLDLRDKGLLKIGRLVVPAIIGLSATQINIFINTNFASRCAEGSVAWLNYAFRLMQFPIGLFGVALSVATLPVIARQASRKDLPALRKTLVSSLIMGFALTVPAAAGLWIMARPVVALIFQHGRFTAADTMMTAQAVQFYSIGLLAYAAVKIVVPVFYALDDTRWPVFASFCAVAANICIILLALERLQHRAIALSTSLTMIMNFLLLATVLYRKLSGYDLSRLLLAFLKIVAASTVMAWVVYNVCQVFPAAESISGQILRIAAGIISGALCYAILVFILRLEEASDAASAIAGRLLKQFFRK